MEKNEFNLSNFDYQLPSSLIAQEPVFPRDSCRLLIVNRKEGILSEVVFKEIVNFFQKEDVLVLNDTRVIKACLIGKRKSGGKIEILLLKEKGEGIWEVLVKPGKRAKIGEEIIFEEGKLTAKILDRTVQGGRILQFFPSNPRFFINQAGKIPLPPYIKKEINDFNKYQTVYSKREGAVAAPTAGLHFSEELLRKIEEKGVKIVYVTLHCGLATFRPVKTEDIRDHQMEKEYLEVSLSVQETVNRAKEEKRRVIAVGTTVVRTLESVAFWDEKGIPRIKTFSGETNFYIFPGYKFKIVDCLITNFHTPLSSNLILVSSFMGLDLVKKSYAYAIKRKYRFYSFGDAMLIT